MSCSFLLRIFSAILSRSSDQFIGYIQEHTELLDKLIAHIQTPAIADCILRIATPSENKAWPIQQARFIPPLTTL